MDDLAQPRGVEVLLLPFAKMQGDAGAARRGVFVFSDGEGAPAVGGPLPALRVAGAPGRHVDPLGDHEGGVEANTELADEVGPLLFIPELLHEGSGAGTGDGAEEIGRASCRESGCQYV